ncbi:T9SS type A sorting domain-containing protein [Flavobacterium paronense]|uniref:T9SS type A sorting domain-containing protein n=1 Tax=Flavobacterium paronense TaxID=1392775 RepID=A0ABV5GE03_9FLAO|nr:T9SS type A sorting domain-containing protein [Flavobacterium paronense]MDN3678157.1 T9SS type A sorting domain-containing protein [Flavobacterium paronense]
MKKIYSLLFLVVASVSFAQTIYTENFGTPTGTTLIPAYITGTAPATFQNSTPIVYSGTGDVRITGISSGYSGASGGGNVFLTNTAGKYFQIDGINTSAFPATNLRLSFGLNATATVQPIVEFSTDGTIWTPITYTNVAGWQLITTASAAIPSTTTLSLRFTQPAVAAQLRIDDVKVFNFNPACTLTLGNPTTLCDAVTFGTDTYTVTIPYTGGTAGAYTFTPSSGTVGGDNPATVAAGNITVSGITEATNFTLNITKGGCSYDANPVTGIDCKPVNALPYEEKFPYTVGTALGANQTWSNSNAGDNILAVAGNLSYTGITSTGNSVSFSGIGAECHTPVTATTATEGGFYARFLMNITDYANVTTDGTQTYFVALTDGVASTFKARLFLKKSGTQYQLGLTSGTTTTNYAATLFNVGDVVCVVLGYDFAGNTLKAWLNPTLATLTDATPADLTDTPTAAITTLGGFLLRQDSATATPTITVDELKITTTVAGLLGVSQNNIAGLKIYPNPVSNGTLFIETAANAEKTVTVFDVLGKQVLNTTTSNNAINVASLHTGVYIVNITEEGKTASRKLVIR